MKKEISANHQSWIVEDFTACELGRCFNCSTPKLHFHCSLQASARWVCSAGAGRRRLLFSGRRQHANKRYHTHIIFDWLRHNTALDPHHLSPHHQAPQR